MQKSDQKKLDYRFVSGVLLLIFLVLVNSYVKDIPWFIVAIPSLLMGVDMESIIKAIKGK